MKKEFRSGCPISSALDIVGDKWTLLIIRDMLVKHKKTFKAISDSDEKIAPSILAARLRMLELYKLIFKTKRIENKKENIYLLTEKGMGLTPIIIEFSLWGNSNLQEFNDIDAVDGLSIDKTLIIKAVQDSYYAAVLSRWRSASNIYDESIILGD